MTVASFTTPVQATPLGAWLASTGLSRALLAIALVAAAVLGFMVTDPATAARAVTLAGPDLTRLLRGMAAIKAAMGVTVATAVFWRLSAPVSAVRLALYAAGCAAMAAGPGLIWNMADVAAGAVVLHAGLALSLILLWRDPAVGRRLSALIASRRRGGFAGPTNGR